jgi:hypothetical protein
MDLMHLLQSQIGSEVISKLAGQAGVNEDQTTAAMNGAFSALLNGLSKNIQQPEGAQNLLSALERDHDGSLLDNLSGFLGGEQVAAPASALNGVGILKHVLGGSQSGVIDMIAKMSGIDAGKSGQLLATLAPILLGALGKLRSNQEVGNQGLLDLITKTNQAQNQESPAGGLFQRLLDRDGDGEIMDDIISMGAKSLLGGLFKR